MAGHPLRSAIDRRLGRPLPHQLANQTRVHLTPPEFFTPDHAVLCAYAVLAVISNCCPPVWGRLPTRYSPVRHSVNPASIRKLPLNCFVRLACVKHAASVHPEPGSNSHVKVLIPVKIRLANFNRYYCCFGSSQNLHFAHRVQLAHACKQSWTRFLSRMFWMFSWTSRLNQKPLFLEFSGFYILFSFQGSLCCLSSNFYSLSKVFAFVNTFLFFYKSTFFRNFSEFVKNLQIISFISCFVFVPVSRTYVMIPEFPRIVNDFSIFVILFILLWFFRIFCHFYLFHTY